MKKVIGQYKVNIELTMSKKGYGQYSINLSVTGDMNFSDSFHCADSKLYDELREICSTNEEVTEHLYKSYMAQIDGRIEEEVFNL
jgi:hypothetical protein